MTAMNRKRFQRLRELFDQAFEQPEQDRESFLERECDGDQELLRDALGMLEIEGENADLFESVGRLYPGTLSPGAVLQGSNEPRTAGRYRLIAELGSGGMGTVYVAERADDEFEKRVALKVLTSKLAEPRLVERFRIERQILANLEHPNIARLIDGGTLDDGRPYLVMELVEGKAITRYCEDASLSLGERIALFCSACEAVEHAHRNLVVHRDIKPSNLLIATDGTPKLLDFGIAKLIESDPDIAVTQTAAHHRAFTPEYASPEQIQGGTITTATDVYALGILLYELLTGERPFKKRDSSSLTDLERSITESLPVRPSARVDREPQLAKRLRGDLDTIVLKALRREPERRYSSVGALVDDLKRHLDGLPVRARPDSLSYRSGKFVRRNQTLVLGAALALLTLIGATIVSLQFAVIASQQRLEAERQTEIATAVNDFLNNDLLSKSNPFYQPDPNLTLREVIDQAAKTVGERFTGRPLVEAGIHMTLGRAYDGLGTLEQSAFHFQRAFDLRLDSLGLENEETLRALMGRLYGVYHAGKSQEALPEVERLVELCEKVLGSDHRLTAQALTLKAVIYGVTRDQWEEIEILEQTAKIHRTAFGNEHRETLEVLNNLAISYDDVGRHDEARSLFEEVLAARRSVLAEHNPATMLTHISIGTNSMYRGELEEAEQIFVDALVDMEPLLGDEHPLYTVTLGLLGRVYRRQGKLDQALETAERTVDVQMRTLPATSNLLSQSYVNVMSLYSEIGRHQEAIDIARQLLAKAQELGGGRVRVAQARLANELRAAGQCDEALAIVRVADPDRAAPQFHQDTGYLLAVRGLCSNKGRETAAVRADLERSFDLLEPVVGLNSAVQLVSAALLEIFESTGDHQATAAHRDRLAEAGR